MLRGRFGKRETSICAFCQHRISISLPRRPGPPRDRLFSATTQCATSHDPSRLRQFTSLPSVAGAGTTSSSLSTSKAPQIQSLSTKTNPTLQQAYSPYRLADENAGTPAPAPAPAPPRPVVGSTFLSFKRARAARSDDDLDPHEARARMNLLAQQQQQQQKAPPQPAPSQIRAAADMRLNNGPGRSQAPSSDQSSNEFVRSRQPVLRDFPPRRHVSGRGPQPVYGPVPRSTPLPRNHLAEPQPSVRKHILGPMPRREDPPSLPERQPSTGQNSDSKDFVASSLPSLAKSEALSPAGASNASATKPDTAVASSGGFDALEAASAHDAKGSARNIGMSQEWGQLARKSTSRPFLSKNLWPGQSNITISRPQRVDTWDTEQPSSEQPSSEQLLSEQPSPAPRAGKNKKKDTVADKLSAASWDTSISSAPPRQGGHDYDHEKKTSKREKKPDKKRGGRRSQQASRFEDDDGADDYDEYQEKRRQKELRKAQREAERTEPIPIILPELISITALANALKIKPDDFLVQLGELGFEGVTLDSLMAGETAALVAQEYGYEPTVDAGDGQDLKPRPPPEDPSVLPSRPPVVTIMGHVDHGKTTILDYLRQSSVAAQEHGGITQHIGAFSVKLSSGKPITFLDTPGHAAFLTMRQRGANVTDIVVLVVAADDSVKPQTLEALKHARAAKVPIIVAINKIDKDGARIDAVKSDLAKAGLEIEDYGGDVQVVCVSGKTGQGMEDLEENILTLSEILDHRAELDGPAEGWVLESSLKPTGKVATVLVKRGTLRPGDYIAAGLTWAKIRQLRNEAGVDVAEAPPGTPVEILGWKDLPAAGDQVIQSPDEDRAKTAVSYREGLREREKDAAEYEVIAEARKALQEKREREKAASEGGTSVQEVLPDEENGTKIVNFVVKGDVHGSVEAVCAAIQEIGSHEVRPRVLRSATGPITESDVDHAATSKSVLVNFATTTPGYIRRMAEEQGVRILEHTIIYHLVDDVKAKLSEYLNPEVSIRVLGEAEILQVFPINMWKRVYKNIAGCRVRNGVVGKNNLYRILRRGEVIFHGKLETLKHVKKDVMEMRKGTECGMGFEEFQDLQVGDQIQAYEEVRTARTFS